MIKILIVHNDRTVRAALNQLLAGEGDLLVAAACGDSADALAWLHAAPAAVDIVLTAYTLPDDGVHALVQAWGHVATAPKLLITHMPKQDDAILALVEEGAAGYVLEDESSADLVKKIRAIHENEFMICPAVAAAVMTRIAELKQLLNELDGGNFASADQLHTVLTRRELDVLHLLGQENSNREIADALTIEVGTVKNHVHNVLRKLDVTSRKHAVQFARQGDWA
jgi:DNA-binding NarL/FixJ family response regulator